jgi:hypothetical protein
MYNICSDYCDIWDKDKAISWTLHATAGGVKQGTTNRGSIWLNSAESAHDHEPATQTFDVPSHRLETRLADAEFIAPSEHLSLVVRGRENTRMEHRERSRSGSYYSTRRPARCDMSIAAGRSLGALHDVAEPQARESTRAAMSRAQAVSEKGHVPWR